MIYMALTRPIAVIFAADIFDGHLHLIEHGFRPITALIESDVGWWDEGDGLDVSTSEITRGAPSAETLPWSLLIQLSYLVSQRYTILSSALSLVMGATCESVHVLA